jgi:uncharacterized protein (TIGR03067 family)
MKYIVLVFALLVTQPGADSSSDVNKQDQAAMQGDWALASMIVDGQTVPDDDCQGLFRTMKGDEYSVFRYEKQISKGTFRLDATKKPKTIDLIAAGGPPDAKPTLGIYKLEDGKLKICYTRPGQSRPKEFSSVEGSKQYLTVWEREKPVSPTR